MCFAIDLCVLDFVAKKNKIKINVSFPSICKGWNYFAVKTVSYICIYKVTKFELILELINFFIIIK